ncbi:MAG: hypothetical protein LBG61_06815 [Burkholderiales bacterium]|jgi:cytochrome c553|nr:hypothetical protein [Burkholderiales bacterium]
MSPRTLFGTMGLIGVGVALVYTLSLAFMGSTPTPAGVIAPSQSLTPQPSADTPPDPQNLSAEDTLKAIKKAAETQTRSNLYAVKCSACHGRDGRGQIGAPIVGKTQDENFAILMKYKNNQVPNTMMRGILNNTSDEELARLADEISKFR